MCRQLFSSCFVKAYFKPIHPYCNHLMIGKILIKILRIAPGELRSYRSIWLCLKIIGYWFGLFVRVVYGSSLLSSSNLHKNRKRCERISGFLLKRFFLSLCAPMEFALSLLIGPTIFKYLRPQQVLGEPVLPVLP